MSSAISFGFTSRRTLWTSQGYPKGDVFVKLEAEAKLKRCSILHRGSFPASCVSYTALARAPGKGFDSGCAGKRGVCALWGKNEEPFSCYPLAHDQLGLLATYRLSDLLPKRSHLIRSRPARHFRSVRSSATTCTIQLVRRLLGFGVPCAS
jgi:hypothetical protein